MPTGIMMNSLKIYFRHVLATSLENWHTYAYYFLYNNLSFCKCVSAIKPKEESWNGITMLTITSHKIIFHYQENPHNVHLIQKLLICSNLMIHRNIQLIYLCTKDDSSSYIFHIITFESQCKIYWTNSDTRIHIHKRYILICN